MILADPLTFTFLVIKSRLKEDLCDTLRMYYFSSNITNILIPLQKNCESCFQALELPNNCI